MRLTTLARKIQITPSKLMAFLEQRKIEIDNGINTKLDETTIALVMKNFAPEASFDNVVRENDPGQTLVVKTEVETPPIEIEEKEDKKTDLSGEVVLPENVMDNSEKEEIPAVVATAPKTGTIDDLEEGLARDIELIKVKKVKLEGIKIVGKIELPEKPIKEDKKDMAVSMEVEKNDGEPKATHRHRHPKKKPYGGKKNGLTLSYEEKLKREEREKQRQLALKKRKEKQRKREHYLKNVQAQSTPALPKHKKQKQTSSTNSKQKNVVIHKNPVKRLWAWLNGEYDKF